MRKTFYITPELNEKIKQWSDAHNMSDTKTMEMAVTYFVETKPEIQSLIALWFLKLQTHPSYSAEKLEKLIDDDIQK